MDIAPPYHSSKTLGTSDRRMAAFQTRNRPWVVEKGVGALADREEEHGVGAADSIGNDSLLQTPPVHRLVTKKKKGGRGVIRPAKSIGLHTTIVLLLFFLFFTRLDYLDQLLADCAQFVMGEGFTIADAYLFVISNWTHFVGIDLSRWNNVLAYVERIGQRSTVKKAMFSEGLSKS